MPDALVTSCISLPDSLLVPLKSASSVTQERSGKIMWNYIGDIFAGCRQFGSLVGTKGNFSRRMQLIPSLFVSVVQECEG